MKTENNYKSILFVPPTLGNGLLNYLRNREEELNKYKNERIQKLEKGGKKSEKFLTKKNSFKETKCEDKWCPLVKEIIEKSNLHVIQITLVIDGSLEHMKQQKMKRKNEIKA